MPGADKETRNQRELECTPQSAGGSSTQDAGSNTLPWCRELRIYREQPFQKNNNNNNNNKTREMSQARKRLKKGRSESFTLKTLWTRGRVRG